MINEKYGVKMRVITGNIRLAGKILNYVFLFAAIFCLSIVNAEGPKAVDKEKRAGIIRLLKALGLTDMMEKAKNTDPVMKDDKLKEEHLKETYELMISSYDKYFDSKEILELTALFENPAWKKFRERSLLISRDMMEAVKVTSEKNKQLIESEKDVPVSKMKADPNSSIGKQLIKSKEGKTRGNLLQIRSAVTKYYAKNEGQYPKSLTERFEEYLAPLPSELITGSNKVVNKFDGSGGWYYNIEQGNKDFSQVFLNIAGKDSQGTEYSKY